MGGSSSRACTDTWDSDVLESGERYQLEANRRKRREHGDTVCPPSFVLRRGTGRPRRTSHVRKAAPSDICILFLSCIRTCNGNDDDVAFRLSKYRKSFAYWAALGHTIVSVDSSDFDLAAFMPKEVNARTHYFRFTQSCPMDSTRGEQGGFAYVIHTPACLSILESHAVTVKITPWYMYDMPGIPLSAADGTSQVDLCTQRSDSLDYIYTETFATSARNIRPLFNYLATAHKESGVFMEHFMGNYVKAQLQLGPLRALTIRKFPPLHLHAPVLARGYSTTLHVL